MRWKPALNAFAITFEGRIVSGYSPSAWVGGRVWHPMRIKIVMVGRG